MAFKMDEETQRQIKEHMFKPILLSEVNGGNQVVVIYDYSHKIYTDIDETKETVVFSAVFVTDSINEQRAVTDKIVAQNVEDFLDNIDEVKDNEEINWQLKNTLDLLSAEVNATLNYIQEMSRCFKTVMSLVNNDQKGLIVNSSSNTNIISAVTDSISGANNLDQNDLEKICNVVLTEVLQNADIDVEDEEQVDKLRKTIEYRFIQSLPDNVSADDISINIEAILSEIRKMQGE